MKLHDVIGLGIVNVEVFFVIRVTTSNLRA
jgi:hypothetical protein